MKTYIERMIEERDALSEKIAKAEAYIQEHAEPHMHYPMTLLSQQVLIMKAYENVLQLRIDYATWDTEGDCAPAGRFSI